MGAGFGERLRDLEAEATGRPRDERHAALLGKPVQYRHRPHPSLLSTGQKPVLHVKPGADHGARLETGRPVDPCLR
jgi:hypothetical protein